MNAAQCAVVRQLLGEEFQVDDETINEFARWGSVTPSGVGDGYDSALADALQEAFDELGIEVG